MPGRSTFVFDGACPTCSASARLIVRFIPTDAQVVAYQLVDLDALGLSVEQAESSVQWVSSDGRTTTGPEAIADLMRSSGARIWRGLGSFLARRPMLALARLAYAWVSRHRYRIPLGRPITEQPPAERARFAGPV